MRTALIILAVAVEIAAWRVVARGGRATEWNLMIALFAGQGALALALMHIAWSGDRAIIVAVSAGTSAGVLLYAGTRVFVAVAGRVPLFRSHVEYRYARAREVSLPVGLALAVLIAVPGEELFWRGLVQRSIAGHTTEVLAVLVTVVLYVAANAASGSLPFVAAAVVGGAVWGGLAAFTGGILASVICHGLWTALMLALPPGAGRGDPAIREMMHP